MVRRSARTAPLKPRLRKRTHVEERGRQGQLAADEGPEGRRTQEARRDRLPRDAVRGGFLDRVDHGDHADQGQGDADRVPGARIRVAGLRQQLDADEDQDGHHRQVDQEDRAPPEVFEQEAADDRADRRAGGGGRAPDADGEAAFARVVEEVADQGQGGGHEGRAGDTQQSPRQDHQLRCGRIGVQNRYRAERGRAQQQDPLAADAVAEAAHRHQQARDDERVDVTDPQELGPGRPEVLADVRGREAEDGRVDGHQQHGEHQDGQREPTARTLHRLGRGRRPQGAGHDSSLRSAPPSSSPVIMWVKSLGATRPAWVAQAQEATSP
ncbi:hypothetical protein RKD46_006959 [Streptomyces pseudovenezuelae]